jgi:magnesium chelatase family protein
MAVRERVSIAREIASKRFNRYPWRMNSEIPAKYLRNEFRAEKSAMALLHIELEKERLSARGFHKVLRLAWSIADSQQHEIPIKADVEKAISLRMGAELF